MGKSRERGIGMNTVDWMIAATILIFCVFLGYLAASGINEAAFIKDNCIKTELVDTGGRSMYDCTGINLKGE